MLFRPFVFALLLLAGCLEFDAQDVTIVHDAKADRIDIHIVYRGLYSSGGKTKRRDPLQEAAEALDEDRRTGRVRLGASLFGIDLTRAEAVASPIAAHIDVETGALFTDAQGVLCEQQFVRIRGARRFLESINAAMELAVQANAGRVLESSSKHRLDDDTLEILNEFLRSGDRLLLIEPGRIELRVPFSDADHRWLKSKMVEGLAEGIAHDLAPAADDDRAALRAGICSSQVLRILQDNEFSIVREQNLTRLALGVKGASKLVISKPPEGRYRDALLTHLQKNGVVIEARVTGEELQRRFAAFQSRDAVLAPDIARLRVPAEPAANK